MLERGKRARAAHRRADRQRILRFVPHDAHARTASTCPQARQRVASERRLDRIALDADLVGTLVPGERLGGGMQVAPAEKPRACTKTHGDGARCEHRPEPQARVPPRPRGLRLPCSSVRRSRRRARTAASEPARMQGISSCCFLPFSCLSIGLKRDVSACSNKSIRPPAGRGAPMRAALSDFF